jgi:beta-lactamase regulating signal transducer with metallopeptidase domain
VSALLETLLAALCLSGLAVCCLVFLPRTPPRVRFAIAVAGLAAWIVPWGAIRIALPASSSAAAPLVDWLGTIGGTALAAAEPRLLDSSAALGYVVAAAFLVGLALFARDWLALQRCLRDWRARSRPAEELRRLLPRELAAVAADIRLVEGSAVAAASGVLRPTIWLGDRHTAEHRTLALVHEMWHVRARDPAWLVAIAAVRRAYWWNPLVAYLARQAVLMIESTCDHRCAALFGKGDYIARLAALLLSATAPAPRLIVTIGAASLDVQRLRLLGETLRLRGRDLLLIGALAAAGTATAAVAVVDRVTVVARSPASSAAQPAGRALPATPAGDALATLVRAANGGDSELLAELLGAYTPQELPLPLPQAPNLRVVDVLHSEPLRIEYVVESAAGARHVGELTVSVAATTEITATRLRPLP